MAKKTDHTILRRFGNRVRELRIQKGITSQIELANKAGLDRTYIGGIERGERNVGIKNAAQIAAALGVPLEELFRL